MKRKEWQKKYQRKRYLADPEYFKQKANKAKEERKRWFKEEILDKSSCITCGESHNACLDFHHRDPEEKVRAVTKMVLQRCSKERILKEIAKCDVLCSNCHRKLHYNERQ